MLVYLELHVGIGGYKQKNHYEKYRSLYNIIYIYKGQSCNKPTKIKIINVTLKVK